LNNFSESNIPQGTPMARLEEVLVPVYLFHRYQTQAAGKSIGGVDYRAALRGDGQKTVEIVPAATQRRSLKLLLGTIAPEALALPRNIIKMIPPRAGVGGGEVFPRHTSPTFDPLAAAESAANITLAVLLNPERAARLISNRVLDPAAPSLAEVIETILASTWKTDPPAEPYLSEIHRVVGDSVLYNLMKLASDADTAPEARAMAALKLDQLKLYALAKATKDEAQLAHLRFAAAQIERYQADPSKFVFPADMVAPPGAPIGTGDLPIPWLIRDEKQS